MNDDEIIQKNLLWHHNFPLDDIRKAMNEACSDTTKKHIGAIWNWWATKPQKSKNDATIRIITRADIEELVKLIDK